MPDINIERLSLSLSGLSENDGRALARYIADGLASASIPDTAAESSASIQSKQTVEQGNSMPAVASRVVADLLRQLDRLQ